MSVAGAAGTPISSNIASHCSRTRAAATRSPAARWAATRTRYASSDHGSTSSARWAACRGAHAAARAERDVAGAHEGGDCLMARVFGREAGPFGVAELFEVVAAPECERGVVFVGGRIEITGSGRGIGARRRGLRTHGCRGGRAAARRGRARLGPGGGRTVPRHARDRARARSAGRSTSRGGSAERHRR